MSCMSVTNIDPSGFVPSWLPFSFALRGCVSLAHGLLSTLQVEQGLETYKYILHPALTKLVTPTTRLMMLSMNDFVIKVLYLSRGEQSHRCGIMGHNILSSQTASQKGKRNITVCLSEKGRPDGHLDRRGGC